MIKTDLSVTVTSNPHGISAVKKRIDHSAHMLTEIHSRNIETISAINVKILILRIEKCCLN